MITSHLILAVLRHVVLTVIVVSLTIASSALVFPNTTVLHQVVASNVW